jgi:hypothetical protein
LVGISLYPSLALGVKGCFFGSVSPLKLFAEVFHVL